MDRSVLNQATAPSDEQVPGYFLTEIVKMSFIPPDVYMQLEDYLLKRLQREDASVKVKTLRVIKALLENGKPDFRRSLRRKADKIRACQSFNCPLHPTLGDTPRKAVRDEASKCLEIIFAEDAASANTDFINRIEGIGGGFGKTSGNIPSDRPNTYNSTDSSQGKNSSQGLPPMNKFVGMGNISIDQMPPVQGPSAYATAGNAFKLLSEAATKYLPSVKQQFFRGSAVLDHSRGGGSGMPGNLYGNNESPGGLYRSPDQEEATALKPTVATRSGNEYEAKLVLDLLSPGGAKASLPQNVLQDFVKKCHSLDLEVITQLVFESYNSSQATMHTKERALSIMEALLTAKELASSHSAIQKYLKENQLSVFREDEKIAHLKGKVQDVLLLLGETVVRVPEVAPKTVDLVTDMFANEEDAAAKSTTGANPMDDLFGDDSPFPPKQSKNVSTPDLFDIFSAQHSATPSSSTKPEMRPMVENSPKPAIRTPQLVPPTGMAPSNAMAWSGSVASPMGISPFPQPQPSFVTAEQHATPFPIASTPTFSPSVVEYPYRNYNPQSGMIATTGPHPSPSFFPSGQPSFGMPAQTPYLQPSLGNLPPTQPFPFSSLPAYPSYSPQGMQHAAPPAVGLSKDVPAHEGKESLESFQNMLLAGEFLSSSPSSAHAKKTSTDAFDFVTERLNFT
ncbi:hypothetical protein IE077_002041 [Cardiosporidium cionae]|uniref:ENTH domain-containing protein n=1 Tax=Cardiosporidium cionae TaxID=476202 RepID=A0ABQ7JBU2_9APIC|nr:hypothetical protein IE077_002041 [Cardiosporidium cionae]|eukprot:KAF8821418.1 hypothetical protein IE077_002041 [Cardiosporidium cionae]